MPTVRTVALACCLMALTACQSTEEKAEKHYENGVSLLAQNDNARAYVEFRNALQDVPGHVPTLQAFANALAAEGRLPQAYRYRQTLVELQPKNREFVLQAALDATQVQDWEAAARYRDAARGLAPQDPRTQLVDLVLRYREMDDQTAADAAAKVIAEARRLAQVLPDNDLPHQLLFDAQARAGEDRAALSEVEVLLARHPENPAYHRMRLALLSRMGDTDAMEQGLRDMVARFPKDEEARNALIAFLVQHNNRDAAERFLRGQIEAGKPDTEARLMLVAFLNQFHGPEAARSQLQDFDAEGTDTAVFRTQLAVMDFQQGQRDRAIASLQQLLSDAEPSDQTNDIKVTLAGMLYATGNRIGAQKLVDEALDANSDMVKGLQMRAQMQIDADDADGAVVTLRRALSVDPGDAQTLTLLAQAYLRNGSRELAGEALSQAAGAAQFRSAEALRYARFLMQDEKWLPAEDALLAALRSAPDSPELLLPLAQIYLQIKDWPRAGQVERRLRQIGTPQTLAQADSLRASILEGQQRGADAVAFLEGVAQSEGATVASQVALLRAHLSHGNTGAARSYLDSLLAQDPDNQIYRLLDPALKNVMGDHAGAEAGYRRLLTTLPDHERLWLELYRTLMVQNKTAEAHEVLNEGLAKLPQSGDLNWVKAGELERDGDPEAAIAIYETLYAQQGASSVVANNLASLLASTRDDEASLDRAWNVARRLRDTDIPAYQDTYGWIAYRRGDLGEALRYLEPAAKGLPGDPSVLYHLGVVYAALPNRESEARQMLQQAIDVGTRQDTAASRAVVELARTELQRSQSGQ